MENTFTSSAEVFEWISKFINLESGQRPKSFLLERMEILTELAGHPQLCAPSIHIAGSKGKGSVTSMLAAILTAAGFKAARYVSPHVIDIRERICLGDTFFSEEIYCAAGDELRNIAKERLPAAINSKPSTALFDSEPTFWELLTLLFFLCARLSKCDVMIVETGMGGRLDSTNVLDPLVTVITLIELEHTKFLGNTITEVAGEKAGIIKPGKPLILAKQCEEALQVFRKKTEEKNSSLFYFPEIAELSNINITTQGTDFTLILRGYKEQRTENREYLHSSFSIPLPGKVQAENAALAIAAVKTTFPQISEDAIRKGLASLKIPARFEKIMEQPPFIIDGAHTPESLSLCIETFCSLYGESARGMDCGGILIFGCAADKDASAMAKIMHQHFAKIIITTPGAFKISDPVQVYETFASIAGHDKTELVLNTQEAVERAVLSAKSSRQGAKTQRTPREEDAKTLPILATGSFYLAAEVRKFVTKKTLPCTTAE